GQRLSYIKRQNPRLMGSSTAALPAGDAAFRSGPSRSGSSSIIVRYQSLTYINHEKTVFAFSGGGL
ncbi:hypothetical protein D7Z54_34385, partial [Salibacterium salarium]